MFLDTVEFSDHLIWTDEFEWEVVSQSQEYNVDGSLEVAVDENVRQAGRPITLKGARNYGLVPRTTVQALRALAADPGLVMSLVLPDERVFNVMFASGEKRVVATPVFAKSRYQDTDYYSLELYLIEVVV